MGSKILKALMKDYFEVWITLHRMWMILVRLQAKQDVITGEWGREWVRIVNTRPEIKRMRALSESVTSNHVTAISQDFPRPTKNKTFLKLFLKTWLHRYMVTLCVNHIKSTC